jgi:excisionase family DNA binding protein
MTAIIDAPLTPAERLELDRYNRAVEASAVRRYRESLRSGNDPGTQGAQAQGGPLGYNTSQAAAELGVSVGAVRRWSDTGALESFRTPGRQRRFSQAQIDQFIGSLEQQNTRIQKGP